MKNSTILDIFNNLSEKKDKMDFSKEFVKNADTANRIILELKEKLDPDLLSLHQKLILALESNWLMEVDHYYSEGFKLGLRLGIECMED